MILNRYTRNPSYLNRLFGNIYDGEALGVNMEMAHSLLDFMQKDKRDYIIPIRPQNIILGGLKNPVLRALFAPRLDFSSFIEDAKGETRINMLRLAPDAKPEQLNYASSMIQSWLDDLRITPNRNNDILSVNASADETTKRLSARLLELDTRSNNLRSKDVVKLEIGEFSGFNSKELFDEFIGPYCEAYNIPIKIEGNIMEVG
jgi:hypothetical protein